MRNAGRAHKRCKIGLYSAASNAKRLTHAQTRVRGVTFVPSLASHPPAQRGERAPHGQNIRCVFNMTAHLHFLFHILALHGTVYQELCHAEALQLPCDGTTKHACAGDCINTQGIALVLLNTQGRNTCVAPMPGTLVNELFNSTSPEGGARLTWDLLQWGSVPQPSWMSLAAGLGAPNRGGGDGDHGAVRHRRDGNCTPPPSVPLGNRAVAARVAPRGRGTPDTNARTID